MVKANELRIGSYINYSGNHRDYDGTFNEEFARYLFDVKDEWDLISGIPLAEEWLLKFGFVGNNEYGYNANNGTGLYLIKHTQWYVKRNTINDGNIDIMYGIKYIHQLQNLYFALTGNELEIK